MARQTIYPGVVQGRIIAPASKSYAQRALAAAMLVPSIEEVAQLSELRNMGLCNDTSAALDVIQRLGATVRREHAEGSGGTYFVQGGFLRERPQELNIGESGLSTRLFTPIAAQSPEPILITGHGSILSRPVGITMAAPLRALGASVTFASGAGGGEGYLPLTVCGPLKGGTVEVDGSLSSQFITGLLMALPLSEADTRLVVRNPKSVPYIAMTIEVLRAFGVAVTHEADYTEFFIRGGQSYRRAVYNVEGDWSGASCLLVAGAVAAGQGDACGLTIDNLNPDSLQADRAMVDALIRAGVSMDYCGNRLSVRRSALRGFEFDATDCPDLFPALAALAAFCEGTTTLRGTARLVHKESDRAATIAAEFAKLGVEIDISHPDLMVIHGISLARGVLSVKNTELDSHNDHRIAMAVAVAALRGDKSVTISGAEAVNKSYPCFWEDLGSICK